MADLSSAALRVLDRMFRSNQASCKCSSPSTWLELKDAGFVKDVKPYGDNWLYYQLTDKGKAYKRLTDPEWSDRDFPSLQSL